MAHKAPEQTNILIHLAIWTIGTPLLFAATGGGLFAILGAPSGETFTVTFLAVIAGLFIGFPLGIVSFFVVRGLRGWARYFDQRRTEREAEKEAVLIEEVQDRIVARLEQSGEFSISDDPWNGTNPYGCCQDNYDTDGNLSHGSPDCLHPLILEQRKAS